MSYVPDCFTLHVLTSFDPIW